MIHWKINLPQEILNHKRRLYFFNKVLGCSVFVSKRASWQIQWNIIQENKKIDQYITRFDLGLENEMGNRVKAIRLYKLSRGKQQDQMWFIHKNRAMRDKLFNMVNDIFNVVVGLLNYLNKWKLLLIRKDGIPEVLPCKGRPLIIQPTANKLTEFVYMWLHGGKMWGCIFISEVGYRNAGQPLTHSTEAVLRVNRGEDMVICDLYYGFDRVKRKTLLDKEWKYTLIYTHWVISIE